VASTTPTRLKQLDEPDFWGYPTFLRDGVFLVRNHPNSFLCTAAIMKAGSSPARESGPFSWRGDETQAGSDVEEFCDSCVHLPFIAQVPARWASLGVITVLRGTTSATLRLEVGDDAEVVASPYPVQRLVEDPCAGSDVEGGATFATADHDVVDRPASHLMGQVIVRPEQVARLPAEATGRRALVISRRVPLAARRAVPWADALEPDS
jgi:hypothetical protein